MYLGKAVVKSPFTPPPFNPVLSFGPAKTAINTPLKPIPGYSSVKVSPAAAAAYRYTSYYPKAPSQNLFYYLPNMVGLHGVQLGAGGVMPGVASGASAGAAVGGPWGAAVGSVIGLTAGLLGGKASDFREWIYFDQNGHYSRTVGDKPNANTTNMAGQVQNAMQQYVSSAEGQGVRFVLPSDFVVNIGSRDASYLWMPASTQGDPAKGPGASKLSLAGPGNPQGVVTSLVNFLSQYRQSGPPQPFSQPASGSATAPLPYGSPVAPLTAPQTQPYSLQPPPLSPQFMPGPTMTPGSYGPAPQMSDMFGGSMTGYMPYILGAVGLAAILLTQGRNQPNYRPRVARARARRR